MPGTFSGGSSTPRSPRATITASDILTNSSKCSIAAGFSSFIKTDARPLINSLASATSLGRWTNDKAIQSDPRLRANSKSSLSFSLSEERPNVTPGTFTPFRFDRVPPVITFVSIELSVAFCTRSLIFPSSRRRSIPTTAASKIS